MWLFKFQNCFNPTPLTSTILVEVTIGVSGLGRDSAEQSGMTNPRRFSYKANKLSKRAGTEDDL
jgi:hypothetical protein